jgi:hypothetical protein
LLLHSLIESTSSWRKLHGIRPARAAPGNSKQTKRYLASGLLYAGWKERRMEWLAVGAALMIAFALALSLQWGLLAAILRRMTRSE